MKVIGAAVVSIIVVVIAVNTNVNVGVVADVVAQNEVSSASTTIPLRRPRRKRQLGSSTFSSNPEIDQLVGEQLANVI